MTSAGLAERVWTLKGTTPNDANNQPKQNPPMKHTENTNTAAIAMEGGK